MPARDAPTGTAEADSATNAYRGYVLVVLMLVYVFNFLDRQILSILAEDIKHDLAIGDGAMGFLLGTAFAIFYAVFGIPLGRAADVVNRTRLIAGGLLLWSAMTSLSGAAGGFRSLALCRMGVGVGEASASPAAYSLLYDYFPKRLRTTVLAFYSSGIFLGAGLGLMVGGVVLTEWKAAYPVAAAAPFGLRAWQAAFMIVGMPGVLLALWVASLREPVRGAVDGAPVPPRPAPLRAIGAEFVAILPGAGLLRIGRLGGARAALLNAGAALVLLAGAVMLVRLLGSPLQWYTLAIGAYAFATWCQLLFLTDRAAFDGILGCRPLVLGTIGFSGCIFLTAATLAWLAVFFQRVHGAPPAEVGWVLGLSYAVMGFAGVVLGGYATDRLVSRGGGRWRLIVAAVAVTLATVSMAVLLLLPDRNAAYAMTLPFNFFSAMYIAPGAANVNSLSPARSRGTASAAYIICQVLLGSAMGPYAVGAISEALTERGHTAGDALTTAMLASLLVTVPTVLLFLAAMRAQGADE